MSMQIFSMSEAVFKYLLWTEPRYSLRCEIEISTFASEKERILCQKSQSANLFLLPFCPPVSILKYIRCDKKKTLGSANINVYMCVNRIN